MDGLRYMLREAKRNVRGLKRLNKCLDNILYAFTGKKASELGSYKPKIPENEHGVYSLSEIFLEIQ